MIFKLVLTVVSVLAGFSAFIAIFILKNYEASVWAFNTGLTASILFQIHWLKYKNRIGDYYTPHALWSLAWVGFTMFALGVSGFIYNVIIFCALRPPILPVKDSVIMSIVWCFLTFKTGALLFWYARKYAHFVNIDRVKLVEVDAEEPADQAYSY